MRAQIIVLAIILMTLFSGCQREANFSDKEIYQAFFNFISQDLTEELTVVISERAETEQDIFNISLNDSLKEMNSSSKLKITSVRELQNLLPASSVRLQAKFIEAINTDGNINKNDIPTNTKIKPLFVSDSELNTFFEKSLAHAWEHFPAKYAGARSLV
jgi:BioD-like phosphotransacetylase family protein